MVLPNGVATVSQVFKIRDGVITDEILLDVLAWLPAEKRIPLYNTKHRGGVIEHDGFFDAGCKERRRASVESGGDGLPPADRTPAAREVIPGELRNCTPGKTRA
jgi:hypothetical protein